MADPAEDFPFVRDQVFPSWMANAWQRYANAIGTNTFRLTKLDASTVQVVPDPVVGTAALPIENRWRYRNSTVTRAVSGGAGTKSIWVVALDNDVDNSPDPFTDHTDYSFDLRVTDGPDPSGAGVEIFEKVGEADWSGTAITAVRQTLAPITREMMAQIAGGPWTATNGAIDRTLNVNSFSLTELGNVMYSLLKDLGLVA